MIECDFVLLIMNCKKYIKKAQYQKKTWLKQIPKDLLYYHVIGDEELVDNYKFDHENKILWVKTKDDYNSLPKKVITSYEAVNREIEFKYIFKTDDDQILVNNNFFNIIQKLIMSKTPKIHYGGFIVDIKIPYLSKYYLIHPELPTNMVLKKTRYCSGRFYLLSYEAILHLISKKENIMSELLEDYSIGLYLHPFFKENMLHISTNDYFTDIEKSDFINEK
jgi:hypothetical protein